MDHIHQIFNKFKSQNLLIKENRGSIFLDLIGVVGSIGSPRPDHIFVVGQTKILGVQSQLCSSSVLFLYNFFCVT